MADKPGYYWDLREARWVKFEATVMELPEPAEPDHDSLRAERDDQVAVAAEVDIRSG
jgi:hypothetical protein